MTPNKGGVLLSRAHLKSHDKEEEEEEDDFMYVPCKVSWLKMCRLLYLLYLQAALLILLMLSVFGTGGEGADRHRLQTQPDVLAHRGQIRVRRS